MNVVIKIFKNLGLKEIFQNFEKKNFYRKIYNECF